MKILVIDIGGSHVKLMFSGSEERRKFDSGPAFTPKQLLSTFTKITKDWDFDAITVGFPAPIVDQKPTKQPNNIGAGWLGYDFAKAFKKPVKVINDAAMQALGSYEGGRMLFLGLGTGLGSALILDGNVVPLELGELRYSATKRLEDCVAKKALKKLGPARWEKSVHAVILNLQKGLVPDYTVLGGGNVKNLKKLPAGTRRGANENAFVGGLRLWGEGTPVAKSKKN